MGRGRYTGLKLDVRRDFAWSDGYLPEVRRVLAANAIHLLDIDVATFHQDVKEATDMLVTVRGVKAVAVRLRRAQYPQRDLTIRAERKSGATTELEKIISGKGDFYLYGWTWDMQIAEWMLVDLHRLRESGLLQDSQLIPNRDGQTAFIAIPYYRLAARGCVVNSRGLK